MEIRQLYIHTRYSLFSQIIAHKGIIHTFDSLVHGKALNFNNNVMQSCKKFRNYIQLLHTPSLNSVIYYYPRCGYIPRGRRPSGIFTPRVVINTLFNEKECAIVVLL